MRFAAVLLVKAAFREFGLPKRGELRTPTGGPGLT
jgi:hypothetical protein